MSSNHIDESLLTKGQVRKLNALRKSVGAEVGERALAEWLSSQPMVDQADKVQESVAGAFWPFVREGRLAIRPRG